MLSFDRFVDLIFSDLKGGLMFVMWMAGALLKTLTSMNLEPYVSMNPKSLRSECSTLYECSVKQKLEIWKWMTIPFPTMKSLLQTFLDTWRLYVIWLFICRSRYYDDAACVLRTMFLEAKAPHLSSQLPPRLPWSTDAAQASLDDGISRQGSNITGTFGQSEELRCVIAVLRQYVSESFLFSSLVWN